MVKDKQTGNMDLLASFGELFREVGYAVNRLKEDLQK